MFVASKCEKTEMVRPSWAKRISTFDENKEDLEEYSKRHAMMIEKEFENKLLAMYSSGNFRLSTRRQRETPLTITKPCESVMKKETQRISLKLKKDQTQSSGKKMQKTKSFTLSDTPCVETSSSISLGRETFTFGGFTSPRSETDSEMDHPDIFDFMK
jgi:hypothetical protein